MNHELSEVEVQFRKGKGIQDQIANTCWVSKSKRTPGKHLLLFDYAKDFDFADYNKTWKILQNMGLLNHVTCSREICMQVKNQQSKKDVEQQTGFELGKEYAKAAYCHSLY